MDSTLRASFSAQAQSARSAGESGARRQSWSSASSTAAPSSPAPSFSTSDRKSSPWACIQ